MSELAFNLSGERFEVPATAAFWRVRRLRDVPRGGPEVVYGKDGVPLVIPIDTDMEGFRRCVDDAPGRYRLDPIDERHRPIEGCAAAYLHLSKPDRPGAPTANMPAAADDRDSIVREVVRANADMVKTIAEKFASVMDAAATLLRAADGAGLPARQPPPPAIDDDEDEDDEDDDEPAQPPSELKPLWDMLGLYMATKMGVPVGSASKPGSAPSAPTTSVPTAGPARNTSPAAGIAGAAAEPPPITPAAIAHFTAIQQQLSPQEAQLAREAAKELSPAEIRSWMHQLGQLSVDDAVALIRKTISSQAATEPPVAGAAAGGAP